MKVLIITDFHRGINHNTAKKHDAVYPFIDQSLFDCVMGSDDFSPCLKTGASRFFLGTGVEIRVLEFFSLTADVLATYTPTDDPKLKDYELQPSLGINIRF